MACPFLVTPFHGGISLRDEDSDDDDEEIKIRTRTQEALSPLGLRTALLIMAESATKEQMRELQKARTPWEAQMLTILNSLGSTRRTKPIRGLSPNTGDLDVRASMIESQLTKALRLESTSPPNGSGRSSKPSSRSEFTTAQKAAGVVAVLAITAAVFASSGGGSGGVGGHGFFVNFSQRFVRPQFQKKLEVVDLWERKKRGDGGFPPFNPNWPGGLP